MTRFNTGQSLTKSLAPCKLADVRGQASVTKSLAAFASAPYSTGFVFTGATGCGKNCTARALAGALGCVIGGPTVAQQCGGFWDLCGKQLSGDDVHDRFASCHYGTLVGSGWKLITVSEADKLTADAMTAFIFCLDNLPQRSVWVFTTNEIDRMDRRFLSRCELIEFESRAEILEPDANEWLKQLWREAGKRGRAPKAKELPGAIMGGSLSYRACILGLQAKLRMAA